MKSTGHYPGLAAVFCVFVIAVLQPVIHSYEFSRYVDGDNSSFILSESEELTCTCTGDEEHLKINPNYYRRHLTEELYVYFDKRRPSHVICNKTLTFNPINLPNGRFNSSVFCYEYLSVRDKFTAVEVSFNVSRLAWKTDDVGLFDFDGKENASTAPCSHCGDRCKCPKDIIFFNIFPRDCCQPGVPFPNHSNDASIPLGAVYTIAGLLLGVRRLIR